jgi:sugar phosphate permease
MFLGGGVSTALTAQLLVGISWRSVYVLYGAVGVIWAVLFCWWYRTPALVELHAAALQRDASIASEARQEQGSNHVTMLALLTMPAMWLLLGQQVFRNTPHVFFSSLFPTFLQKHHHLELLGSGWLASVPLLATLVGCMASGYAVDLIYLRTADRSASRRFAAVFGLALAGFAVLGSLWISHPLGATLVMSLGAFGSAFGGVASFTIAMDIGGDRTGTVFGLMNTAGNLGAAIAPQMMDEIVSQTHNWLVVVVVCGIMYLLAALCWLAIRSDRSINA